MCDDSDQALRPTKVCEVFKCQTWEGDRQVKPALIKSPPHGFWLCTKCKVSYGVEPFKGAEVYPVGTMSTDKVVI